MWHFRSWRIHSQLQDSNLPSGEIRMNPEELDTEQIKSIVNPTNYESVEGTYLVSAGLEKRVSCNPKYIQMVPRCDSMAIRLRKKGVPHILC